MKKEESEKSISLESTRKFLSFSFIYSMLFNRLSKTELDDYHKISDFYDEGCIFNIEVNLEKRGSLYVDYKMLCIFYQEIQKRIPNSYCCMTGPLIANRILLYLSRDTKNDSIDEQLFRKEQREIAEEIRKMLIAQGKFKVNIGIGSWRPISEIGISYDESLRCARYRENLTVSMIEDKEYNGKVYEYRELKKKFLASVKYGDEKSLTLFSQIMEQIAILNLDTQKNLLLELLILSVEEVYSENDARIEETIDFIGYAEELSKLEEKELKGWAYTKFQYLTKILRQRYIDKKGYVIKNVKAYLEEHYDENISLQDAANEAGMTPQYFSTIFKQSTGQNFIEWLSEFRIKKAKEYLDEPGAVIKEVCFKVGYNDPNYFSRIFKKISGVTPKEYMS